MSTIVALVSKHPQEDLVGYLTRVGFAVRSNRTPLGAHREGTLVWLTEPDADAREVIDNVRVWLGADAELRAVIVSDRPVHLRDAVADGTGRVVLLPAPVFNWQLVDALRGGSRP